LTIKSILKPVLLILLGSIAACIKPEKKGVEYNSYTEQIVENHLLIKEKIQSFSDSLPNYTDTASFFQNLHPLIMESEKMLMGQPKPVTHKDSLLFAADSRINNFYQKTIHQDFAELFRAYSGVIPEHLVQQTIDSISQEIKQEDYNASTYFNSLLDTSLTKIPLLK
jgi:hypothetical protein